MMRWIVFLLVLACCSSEGPGADAGPDAIVYPAPPPPPDGGYPSCVGVAIPEAGPCCENLFCIDVRDAGACPPTSNEQVITSSEMMFGMCTCGAMTGPYENPDGSVTTCCYISQQQSCM